MIDPASIPGSLEAGSGPASDHPGAVARLQRWPTTPLASLPTRLLRLDRLGESLGHRPLYAKMDAETGFALGGNKVRKLEFVLAPGEMGETTCLITAGGPQSNHCRVTAAFAARHGLRCILVTNRAPDGPPRGNALLHRLFGAEIDVVEDRTERTPRMNAVAAEVESEGGRPMIVPIGASTPLGSLGYARAALELCAQLDALGDGCEGTTVFCSSSSGGTLAGLVLGLALLGRRDVRLVGVSADTPAAELQATCLDIASGGAALLGVEPDLAAVPFRTDDGQVGDGYGIPTDASREATGLFGGSAGIVLDPTYTSKAAAALVDALRAGRAPEGERVVFLHTGGAPGLLA